MTGAGTGPAFLACPLRSEAALALEHGRQTTGRLPERLGDLVPDFLPAVPRDPMSGEDLRYRPASRGFLLYSVGTDGRNDGGSVRTEDGETYRTLFDGRDWVFPRPLGRPAAE